MFRDRPGFGSGRGDKELEWLKRWMGFDGVLHFLGRAGSLWALSIGYGYGFGRITAQRMGIAFNDTSRDFAFWGILWL